MDAIAELLSYAAGLHLNVARISAIVVIAGAVVRFAKPRFALPQNVWPWVAVGLCLVLSFAHNVEHVALLWPQLLAEGIFAALATVGVHEAAKAPLRDKAVTLLGQSADRVSEDVDA